MAVEDWSTTAASNTTLGSIALGENAMSVNDINNATRELMKQIADWRDGAIAALGDSADYQPLDATLTALAAVTTAANKLIYATGSDTFSTTDITAYGRTLLALASKSAVQTELSAITSPGSSLAKPGYVKLDFGGTVLMVQWGNGTIGSNTTGTISFPQTYASFAVCVVSGATSTPSNEGQVSSTAATGLSSQSIVHSGSGTAPYNYIVIGV